MSSSKSPQQSQEQTDEDLPFTTNMRIFGGIAWGSITTFGIAVVLILIPQVPRSWLWATIPIWVGLAVVGIGLQWSIARGACPKCGKRLVVPPMGKRCPQCRSYLKAVDRNIVKVT
jgi:hypothetical protein